MDKMQGGYQALQIRLLNGRLFQKLLSKEPDAQYRSEQGKILTILWKQELGDLGWAQKEIGDRVSKELGEIFYQGFSDQEIQEFEAYQERIITNLKAKENDI